MNAANALMLVVGLAGMLLGIVTLIRLRVRPPSNRPSLSLQVLAAIACLGGGIGLIVSGFVVPAVL